MLASDVSAKRLAQTEARLRRYAYAERVKFAVADAADAKGVEGSFDLILVRCALLGNGDAGGESGDSASVEGGGVGEAGGAAEGDSEGSAEAAGAGWAAGVFDVLAGAGGV